MTENSEISVEKAALRAWARERRHRINIAEASSGVVRQIESLPAFPRSTHVLLYLALPEEIDVEALIRGCADKAKQWYAPRCAPERQLTIHPFDPLDSSIRPGPFGIREPDPGSSPEIDPSQIDLALVPGLLYTRDGVRLGNGGGYYDRFLPKLSPQCVIVGITAEALLVSDLPCDPWDIAVQIVATEARLYIESFPA